MRLDRPKRSVARSWGLPPGSSFVAIPNAILSVLGDPSRKPRLDARHIALVVAIADRWHSDQGPVFDVSIRELALSVHLPKSNIARSLQDLQDAGLISVTVTRRSLPMSIDIGPLIAAAAPKRPLSHTRDKPLSHERDKGVPPLSHQRDRSVPLPGSRLAQTSEQEEPEVASLGSDQSTANGNGQHRVSEAEKRTVKAALDALSAPKRHPRAIDGESWADTTLRLARELEDG